MTEAGLTLNLNLRSERRRGVSAKNRRRGLAGSGNEGFDAVRDSEREGGTVRTLQ